MKKNENSIAHNLKEKIGNLYDTDDFNDDIDEIIGDLDNIVVLNDENGDEIEFEFLDLIIYQGEEYIVLLPVEDDDGADEVVILKVDESDVLDEEAYVSVEDDDILLNVFNIFKDKFKDEFNFVD